VSERVCARERVREVFANAPARACVPASACASVIDCTSLDLFAHQIQGGEQQRANDGGLVPLGVDGERAEHVDLLPRPHHTQMIADEGAEGGATA
jgi:hypothetical protein